jgi:hypothetical protein
MWTPEEMDAICHALRAESVRRPDAPRRVADEALVDEIDANIDEYRDWYAKNRAHEPIETALVPPDELRPRLWLVGWMIYEASWQVLQRARPADRGGEIDTAARLVGRLADTARALPWPHFAPRALGAIRDAALLASKRDTSQGYNEAFHLHDEARDRHGKYVANHGEAPGRERELLGLKEIFLQLVLAETGTACRTAERVISRWSEELDADEPQWERDDEDYWVQLMFRRLSVGVRIGTQALDAAHEIEQEYGFTREVNRDRHAQFTAFRNPGIMTARATLLLLPLSYEMEALGLRPGAEHASWPEMRARTLKQFRHAYTEIEKPVPDKDGRPMPLSADHQRSLVQLRLNIGLLEPGFPLPSHQDFAPCLRLDVLDDEAVQALCGWLAGTDESGRRRGDANAIGSATMPAFIRSVDTYRALRGVGDGYRDWRLAWLGLDRYADEPGREDRVRAALRDGQRE